MEAMVGATMGALTIYDMCKGLDKSITLTEARLLKKSGGKTGDYIYTSDEFSQTKIN